VWTRERRKGGVAWADEWAGGQQWRHVMKKEDRIVSWVITCTYEHFRGVSTMKLLRVV
jgi:hypothetical protein